MRAECCVLRAGVLRPARVQELQSLGLLASTAAPEPRAVTAEDISKMPFLDAIVHESLRLMAPAPNGGFRLLEKDTMVRPSRITRGVCCPPNVCTGYAPCVTGAHGAP